MLEYAIIGAGVSLLIQFLKNKFGFESSKTKFVLIFIALAVGTVWTFLQGTVYAETVLKILASASAVWALFIHKGKE